MAKKGTQTPTKVQRQKEEAARIAAEHALTAKQHGKTPEGERTLEEKLADIDRRARERAADEKRQLASQYLSEARNAFKRAVSNTTDEAVKEAFERMTQLEKLAPASDGQAAPSGGTGRTKRNKEQLKADAEKIAAFLEKHPGSKASDIKAIADYGLSVKDFLSKYTGKKIKTEGERASMTYSLA